MNTTLNVVSEIRKGLAAMIGKRYLYGGIDHTFMKFEIHEKRGRVEIFTNRKSFDRTFDSMGDFMDMFKPLDAAAKNGSPVQIDSALGHTQSDVIVYKTADYSIFKKILGNRELDQKKIKHILEDIKGGIDVLKYYPIQVFVSMKGLDVIDGQHRLFIGKKLKREIHYIIIEQTIALPDIAKINSNTSKWKPVDFINCYVEQENKNYVILKQFIEQYKFSVTISIKLLAAGNPGTEEGLMRFGNIFQRGSFEVKFYDQACMMADAVTRYSFYPHYKDRGFVIAIYRIMKAGKVDMEELHQKISSLPELLTKQSGYKENILQLENIFNRGKSIRRILF